MSTVDLAGPGAARHSDPDTTQQAGRLERHNDRKGVLVVLSRHPAGLTDFELANFMGRQQTSVGKRRGELRDKGYVVDTGERRPAPSGSKAIVWAITLDGRAALKRVLG